jgi:hypothetical protein
MVLFSPGREAVRLPYSKKLTAAPLPARNARTGFRSDHVHGTFAALRPLQACQPHVSRRILNSMRGFG